MLNCAEQVQVQKCKAHAYRTPKQSSGIRHHSTNWFFYLLTVTTCFSNQQIYYCFCITKKVISDVCCRPLSWKHNKMAAKQHVNNSSLYPMLCIHNLFDHWNQIVITLSKFSQEIYIIDWFFNFFRFFKINWGAASLKSDWFSGTSEF